MFALALVLPAYAEFTNGQAADKVLGQANFTSGEQNNPDGARVFYPFGVCVDSVNNRLFVADTYNNRVLWWNNISGAYNGQPADGVLGQTDFKYTRSGSVSARTLNGPTGVAVDSLGNVYVSDTENNRILRFNQPLSNGMNASAVIGQPNFTLSSAGTNQYMLNNPYGIAIDSADNLYVADYYANRILRFDAPITTYKAASLVLGQADYSGSSSNRGGAIAANAFDQPIGVAVDAAGNVYTTEVFGGPWGNRRVLRFSAPLSDGMNADLVLGSNNFTTKGTTLSPTGIAVDLSGNIYMSDVYYGRFLKFSPPFTNGMAPTQVFGVWQWPNYDICTDATLHYPESLSVDNAGNIYVADSRNNRILKYSGPLQNGQSASLVLGQKDFISKGVNNIGAGTLYNPSSVVVDSVNKKLFVSDVMNGRVLFWNNISNFQNSKPADGVLGQSNFYLSDGHSSTANGLSRTLLYPGLNLACKYGLALDKDSSLYVADRYNHRVLRFDPPFTNNMNASMVLGTSSLTTWSMTGGTNITNLNYPADVCVDKSKNVYVADYSNNRVIIYNYPQTSGMSASVVLGQANFDLGSANRGGAVGVNTLSSPLGVYVDKNDNLFVCDSSNHRVVMYSPPFVTGMNASLVLGQADFTHGNPLRGTSIVSANNLNYPESVFVDNSGNVFIADFSNHRVIRYNYPITNGMNASLVLGQENLTTNVSSAISAEKLHGPMGVYMDGMQNLYVVDFTDNRVLRYNNYLFAEATSTCALTVTLQNAKVKIDIPAGALTQNASIYAGELSPIPESLNKNIKCTSIGFEINLSNTNVSILKDISVTVFDFADNAVSGFVKNQLCLGYYNEADGRWVYLSSTRDLLNNIVTAKTKHFSKFAIIELSLAINLDTAIVYPNPFRPGSGGSYDSTGVTFSGLTANSRIRVMSIAGEMVADLNDTDGDGIVTWNAVNSQGQKLASGVYIYLITDDQGNKKTGRLAVIR